MKNLKVKIVCGFRKDEAFTIEAEEAHKAYYLFAHPTERAIFSSGLALKGSDIDRIEPDYNATMGWNKTHQLGDDDWNEISSKGVDRKLRDVLSVAREVSNTEPPQKMSLPLSEIRPLLNSGSVKP